MSRRTRRLPATGRRWSQLKVGSMTAKKRVSSAVAPMSTSMCGATAAQVASISVSGGRGAAPYCGPKGMPLFRPCQRAALTTTLSRASTSATEAAGARVPTAALMACSMCWRLRVRPSGALCSITRRNRVVAPATSMSWAMASAPEEWPNSVTSAELPPNAPLLRCTQRRASSKSSRPRLGGVLPLPRNPNSPSRYVTATNTTRCSATQTAGS